MAQPGASAWYLGGVVIYTAASREASLGISKEDMKGIRSASEPFARLMAARVRERHAATWGLAETGAAGPTGNRYGDAPGHACLAVAGPFESAVTIETAKSDRRENMQLFARRALALLEEMLRK